MILLSFGLFVIFTTVASQDTVVRQSFFGPIRGYSVRLSPAVPQDNRLLDVFTGIPYAIPPVGERRWSYPEPPEPWTDIYNATQYKPCCAQTLGFLQDYTFGPDFNSTSEDCLYLNIFAPRKQNESSPTTLYPVMVWIHGGSNRYGCGEEYDGRTLPRYDVVFVTLNYRLGAIGFLSTADSVAPGNYGLLDQTLALQWVKNNIQAFGGNPDTVTIFGESSGGANVAHHMFSPLSQGLFHAVIAQSGDATADWAVYRDPSLLLENTRRLAELNNCPTTSSQQLVDCLRLVDATVLEHSGVKSSSDSHGNFTAVIDNYFFPATPEELLKSGEFSKVPFMSGTVPDETAEEYAGADAGWSRETKEELMYSRSRRYGAPADDIYNAFIHEYDLPGNDYQEQRDLYLQLRADQEYTAPHDEHMSGHSALVSESFLFSFQYRSQNAPFPLWWGVPHFEECYYVFGVPLWNTSSACPWGCNNVLWYNRQVWLQDDVDTSELIMTTWTNMAKYGSPDSAYYTLSPYNSSTQYYTVLGTPGQWTTGQYYKYRRTSFFNRYFPTLFNTTNCPATP